MKLAVTNGSLHLTRSIIGKSGSFINLHPGYHLRNVRLALQNFAISLNYKNSKRNPSHMEFNWNGYFSGLYVLDM